jgi:hypothetical protein
MNSAQLLDDLRRRVEHLETLPRASGSGGATISTGAAGSEPGSPATGDLYLPNNGFVIERYSGSLWAPWGPLFPLVAPVNGDFAWVNQGGASVDTTNGGIFLSVPQTAGNLRIRKQSAPTAPYAVNAFFLPSLPPTDNNGFGLVFRQSSDGKICIFGVSQSGVGLNLISAKWTNATTFSAVYSNLAWGIGTIGAGLWLRIADDNTDRVCSISGDGQHWTGFHSVTRTDFLTADEVGFYGRIDGGGTGGVTLLSWEEE